MAADPRYGRRAAAGDGGPVGHRAWEDLAVAEDHEGWLSRSRVFLTPIAAPSIPLGTASPSFAFWFIALTLVTSFGALGALAQNLGLFTVLGTLSAGSALTAAGFYAGSLATLRAGGWLFVISAAAAWLVAGAMVLEHSFGRTIIPLGKWSARANIPGPGPPTRSSTRPACPASASASSPASSPAPGPSGRSASADGPGAGYSRARGGDEDEYQ